TGVGGAVNAAEFFASSFRVLLVYTAIPTISTLSLHDALPISAALSDIEQQQFQQAKALLQAEDYAAAVAVLQQLAKAVPAASGRSEEHTSELQSRENLVCRLLLEKKNSKNRHYYRPRIKHSLE